VIPLLLWPCHGDPLLVVRFACFLVRVRWLTYRRLIPSVVLVEIRSQDFKFVSLDRMAPRPLPPTRSMRAPPNLHGPSSQSPFSFEARKIFFFLLLTKYSPSSPSETPHVPPAAFLNFTSVAAPLQLRMMVNSPGPPSHNQAVSGLLSALGVITLFNVLPAPPSPPTSCPRPTSVSQESSP